MFNNNKWKQSCCDKDMCRKEKKISIISIISIFISVIAAVIELVLIMTRIFDIGSILFVFLAISIFVLPYIGVKIDLWRGYE